MILPCRSWRSLAFVVAGSLLVGCGHHSRVLNPTVDRAPVVFESPTGADTFEEALEERYDDGAGRIAVQRAVLSENAFFNREVGRADLDGDGIISDREALRYSER